MVWFNQVKKAKAEAVHTVKCSASQKGWILCCESYEVFVYTDSKERRFIHEALEVWSQKGLGRELVITPDKVEKKGYVICPGKDCSWFFDELNDVYVTDVELLNGMKTGDDQINPFLLSSETSSPPSLQLNEAGTSSENVLPLTGKTRRTS